MPGWTELSSYSALAALFFGGITALSFWAVGRTACGRYLRSVPDFLRFPTECVAGGLVLGLSVQLLAMAHFSSAVVMKSVWGCGAAVALLVLLRCARPSAVLLGRRKTHDTAGWLWAPVWLLGAALLLAAFGAA